MSEETLWQTKLAARLHDPAEKALVLLRDPAGHEGGTSHALFRLLGYEELGGSAVEPDTAGSLAGVVFQKGIPASMYRHVQRADWWASAADRPQWPSQQVTVRSTDGERSILAVAPWAQVRWTSSPVLIHPLTGATVPLPPLHDTGIGEVKQRSFDHFSHLLNAVGPAPGEARDWRKALLAVWRFGPEISVSGADAGDDHRLGELWKLLPADTRVPDHSIWDHLDLTSAFAGAFSADPDADAALLAISLGPVQSFIAAARKMDDLWAGSHLLSRLAWETMRPIAETLGPDAVLFPRLRGLPQVDVWLRDQMGLPRELFASCDWTRGGTDANPLFSAALPNRFVAIVPAAQARALAGACRDAGRRWLNDLGLKVVDRLLEAAGLRVEGAARDESVPAYGQIREQLAGFPEVSWAAVPFSLIRCRDSARQRDPDCTNLLGAMAPFFGVEPGSACGFLDTPVWKALSEPLTLAADGRQDAFFAPNPGTLYPAVYDLLDRVLAASKATRPFTSQRQAGWRDSLTGEAEWLTTDRMQLTLPPGQRTDTLWARVAARKPAWARPGEHLGALSATKRLWPTLFVDEVKAALGGVDVGRFVISTHTMALAHQLDRWLEGGGLTAPGLEAAVKACGERVEAVALPARLVRRYASTQAAALADARRIPAMLDIAGSTDDEAAAGRLRQAVEATLAGTQDAGSGRRRFRPEAYYALLMLDGDRMGSILSGDPEAGATITYRDSFHPQVRAGFDARAAENPGLARYAQQQRAVSPGRHLAISGALNDFAHTVVRHVVEREYLGRVIYAGGDDVLAMLPVADLLPCLQRLRHAYSGTLPEDASLDWGDLGRGRDLHCKGGFAMLRGRLMRMMGSRATASAGAVIAHHQAPLSAVMRALRAAEQRAKTDGGRDAFTISVLKRSGGALEFTAKWGEPAALLEDLVAFLRNEETSRRAVYNSLAWLRDLPEPGADASMLNSLLAYQLARQSGGDTRHHAPGLAARLTAQAMTLPQGRRKVWLGNFLSVAEFLGREIRSGGGRATTLGREDAA
jgi:CRISPR-associated protein Cmr2